MESSERRLLRSLMVMGALVEARDHYTGGHLWRMSQMAKIVALKTGLSDAEVLSATVGGWLHDLGKVAVPDAILLKGGPLDAAEQAIMRRHPSIGLTVVEQHPLAGLAAEIIAHHHERWDGSGYPTGLAGEAIPRLARLAAVVDAFDAMTSVRPYRQALAEEEAIARLEQAAWGQFDGQMVAALAQAWSESRFVGIVGHHDFGRPLVLCPRCGPVMAPPASARDGDYHTCRSCLGTYRLQAVGNSFEAQPAAPGTLPLAPTHHEQVDGLLERL